MTVFDRVKELADRKGMSIADVEEKVGMGKNAIYKWKKQKAATDKLELVADYFGVSVDYLLGRENLSPVSGVVVNEIAEFYRKVTSDMEMNESEEQELKDDFKAYLEMRARLLKNKGKGK